MNLHNTFLAALCVAAVFAGPNRAHADGNAENGAKIAKQCAACHTFDKDGSTRVGPNLYGVFGAAKGAKQNYAYSSAMKAKGGKWDAAALDGFLTAPMQYVVGTKMAFPGLKKPQDRADVIQYLQSLK